MLVVAGKNAPRVPVSEINQSVEALKQVGTPRLIHYGKDVGHGSQRKQSAVTAEFLQEFLLK